MIGVDWGTSSFRAFRIDAAGAVLDRIAAPRGIMTVPDDNFAAVLREQVEPWLADGETSVLMAGMIGSRQGWVEAPYLPCPASPDELAEALVPVIFDGASVLLVPGLSDRDESGVPEVLRGEETQLVGVLDALGGEGTVCLPGSHSKWARLAGGRIEGFATYLSGEAFAAIRSGTILGRMMPNAPHDPEAFARGVQRSGEPGHLLHHLFGVRTLGLFGSLPEAESASYLSGLLIGTEIRAAMPQGGVVHLVGATSLCELYREAIALCGGEARIEDEDAAARGLARIGGVAAWS